MFQPFLAQSFIQGLDPRLIPLSVHTLILSTPVKYPRQSMGWTMVDNTLDSVGLTTAASILGLSVATLRKRLQRGTIAGFKAADGSWRVALDKVDSPGQMGGQGLDSAGQDHAALVGSEGPTVRNRTVRNRIFS